MKLNTLGRLNRRSVLLGAGAAAALLPRQIKAAEFEGLEAEVAQKARALAEGRDVTLRMIIPNGSDANVEPVAAAFSEQTGIKIEIDQTHVDDINTRLILDTLGDENSFDVALPATFGLPDLIAAEAILPLTAFAARHEPSGFRDGILYSIGDRFDGEIYGFQTDGDAYLMFYNTAFLDEGRRWRSLKHGTSWTARSHFSTAPMRISMAAHCFARRAMSVGNGGCGFMPRVSCPLPMI